MHPNRREPEPVGAILPSLLKDLAASGGGATLRSVQEAWSEVVGGEAGKRSRPASLKGGILVVETDSSALKHHLSTFRGGEILGALRLRFPGVAFRAIRFR